MYNIISLCLYSLFIPFVAYGLGAFFGLSRMRIWLKVVLIPVLMITLVLVIPILLASL